MPGVTEELVDSKEARKHEISEAFLLLMEKLALRTQDVELNTVLIAKLQQYEAELLNEIDYLGLKFDHPLRATRSLFTAMMEPSSESHNAFQKEVADSKFNPRTRALAWGLLVSLGFTALVTFIGVAILFGIGAPLAIVATGAGYGSGISLGISIPLGSVFGDSLLGRYAPVMKAKKTGDEIAKHLLLFKPAAANPVEYLDPNEIRLLPVAL